MTEPLSPGQAIALASLARALDIRRSESAARPSPVASREDLVAMKLSAIAGRGAARDFWDLHALLLADDRSLEQALDAFRRKYVREDVGHVVKSLVYFADAESQPLPRGMTAELWRTIRSDFDGWVREI